MLTQALCFLEENSSIKQLITVITIYLEEHCACLYFQHDVIMTCD